MKSKFILFKRAGVYYAEDTVTRKQNSLRTRDKAEAGTLLNAKNESYRQPVLNLQIARAYLTASDPAMAARTWQAVMDQMQTQGKDSSKTRYIRAMKSQVFDGLRRKKLIETTAADFLGILNGGGVSAAHFLKRVHNLALALGWIPVHVLAPALWPNPRPKPKRAITIEEHQRILAAEKNRERNLYYQLLWEVGASQSDAAMLTNDNLDRATKTLSYFRMKTGELAQLAISRSLLVLLEQLPKSGPLFPRLYASQANLRASEFYYLCKRLNIQGVTLHSYRCPRVSAAGTQGASECRAAGNSAPRLSARP